MPLFLVPCLSCFCATRLDLSCTEAWCLWQLCTEPGLSSDVLVIFVAMICRSVVKVQPICLLSKAIIQFFRPLWKGRYHCAKVSVELRDCSGFTLGCLDELFFGICFVSIAKARRDTWKFTKALVALSQEIAQRRNILAASLLLVLWMSNNCGLMFLS